MAVTISLKPELEEWLNREAQREGITPEEAAARFLEVHWTTARSAATEVPPPSESELMDTINDGFAEPFWQRFRELRDKLEAETLTGEERREFLSLNSEVESKNARRMEALLQLSRMRGVTLPSLMKELGVGPVRVP